jgi:hypothetical protein
MQADAKVIAGGCLIAAGWFASSLIGCAVGAFAVYLTVSHIIHQALHPSF